MTYRVVLTFVLQEDVTPDYLAQRVVEACANFGALRPGEGVVLPSDPGVTLRFQPLTEEERVERDREVAELFQNPCRRLLPPDRPALQPLPSGGTVATSDPVRCTDAKGDTDNALS